MATKKEQFEKGYYKIIEPYAKKYKGNTGLSINFSTNMYSIPKAFLKYLPQEAKDEIQDLWLFLRK